MCMQGLKCWLVMYVIMTEQIIALGVSYFFAVTALDVTTNVGTIDDLTSLARIILVRSWPLPHALMQPAVFEYLTCTAASLQECMLPRACYRITGKWCTWAQLRLNVRVGTAGAAGGDAGRGLHPVGVHQPVQDAVAAAVAPRRRQAGPLQVSGEIADCPALKQPVASCPALQQPWTVVDMLPHAVCDMQALHQLPGAHGVGQRGLDRVRDVLQGAFLPRARPL